MDWFFDPPELPYDEQSRSLSIPHFLSHQDSVKLQVPTLLEVQNHQMGYDQQQVDEPQPEQQTPSPTLDANPAGFEEDAQNTEPIATSTKAQERKNYLRGINAEFLDHETHQAYILLYGGQKTFDAFKRHNKFIEKVGTFWLLQAYKTTGKDPVPKYEQAIKAFEKQRSKKYPQFAEYRQTLYKNTLKWIPKLVSLPHNASISQIRKMRFKNPKV